MSAMKAQSARGGIVYTKGALTVYDFAVIAISHRFIWGCPAQRLEEHYNRHVTANHLDVGVGTGYFLDRCRFPTQTPRIVLMDLNPAPLDFASRRIERYKPKTYRRNILEPLSIDAEGFDSVGINDVLHCVPGSIESKAIAFDHLKALMNPHAILFGSTVLQGGVPRNWLARGLMEVYNRGGIFSNRQDSLDDLKHALGQRFRDVSLEVVGCVAIFSGRI